MGNGQTSPRAPGSKGGGDDEVIANGPHVAHPEHTGYLWFYPEAHHNDYYQEPLWSEWHLQPQKGVLEPVENSDNDSEYPNFKFDLRLLESISFECPPGADRPFAINLRESPGSNQTSGRTLEFQAHNEEEWREWGLWIARALSYRSMGINGPRSACKRSQNNLEHLMSHVHDGHHEEVCAIVRKYGVTQCLSQRDRLGNHPLLAAAAWGHHQVLGLILEAPGVEKSVTLANRLGEQALVAAASRNHLQCLSKLLACYRPPVKDHDLGVRSANPRSEASRGLLRLAGLSAPAPPERGIFRQRGTDIIKRKHKHKHKKKNKRKHMDKYKLSSSSWQHRLTAIQHNAAADEARAERAKKDEERLKVVNDALLAAAKAGSAGALELLLQQDDVDAHIIDEDTGQTLAHCALQSRDAHHCLCLLADFSPELLSLADMYGNTPLHHAAAYGFVKSTLVLLQSGVNPHNTNVWGRTPIAIATVAHSAECAHTIYDYGDDRRAAKPAPFAVRELQQHKHSLVVYEDRSAAEAAAKPVDMERIMMIWERFFSNAISGVTAAPAARDTAKAEAKAEAKEKAKREAIEKAWVEVLSEDGELVYFNNRTEAVQWAVPGRDQWEICTDHEAGADGGEEDYYPQRFFFNVITGEQVWELPRWELMQEEGSGEWFFYDTETGDCSWEDPNQLQEAAEWATEEWTVHQDEESGHWYYYNNYTEVSEWAEVPDSAEQECVTRHWDEDNQCSYWHDATTDVSWWDNGDFDAEHANQHYQAYTFEASWGKEMYVWEVCKDDNGNEYYFLTNPSQGLEDAVDNSRWTPPESGWLLRNTDDQHVYYQDIASGDVSWFSPHEQEQSAALALEDAAPEQQEDEDEEVHTQWEAPDNGWLERYSEEDGALFYEDLETAETAWVLPDGVRVPTGVQAPHLPRAGAAGQLMWREQYTEEGHTYFSLLRKQVTTTHIEVGYSQLLAAYDQWEEQQDDGCLWQPYQDDEGNEFFMHMVTGESSWTRPTDALAEAGDADEWTYLEDGDGNGYWYSSITGESVWAEE